MLRAVFMLWASTPHGSSAASASGRVTQAFVGSDGALTQASAKPAAAAVAVDARGRSAATAGPTAPAPTSAGDARPRNAAGRPFQDGRRRQPFPSLARAPGPSAPSPASAPVGARCLVPMWGEGKYACLEHEDHMEGSWMDSRRTVRVEMPDGTKCTVAPPAFWMASGVPDMTCKAGVWVDGKGKQVSEIAVHTATWFHIASALAASVSIFIIYRMSKSCVHLAYSSSAMPSPDRHPMSTMQQHAKTLALCTVYFGLSAGLIFCNNFLVQKGRFPYTMALTAIQMFTALVFTLIILSARPSLMPGVERCKGRLVDLYKRIVPIGCLLAVNLFAGNTAYMYCSVAFLQFMKKANVVLVFVFSALVGLQVMNRQRLFVIGWIILGSSMSVSGELHFVFIGFVLQGLGQVAECMRVVIAEMVLTGSDLRLDPLSYTFFVAPVSLAVLIAGTILTWDPAIPVAVATWWHYLIPNACIAVCLGVAIASVITETSAVGFVIAGVVKDIGILLFSSVFFHEVVTGTQWLGFVVTLGGVFFWSYMRMAPESRTIAIFEKLLMVGRGPFPGTSLASLGDARRPDAGDGAEGAPRAGAARLSAACGEAEGQGPAGAPRGPHESPAKDLGGPLTTTPAPAQATTPTAPTTRTPVSPEASRGP